MFTTSFKPIQPCPLPANLVLLCYYCSLLSPCLVCMLRMLRCYPVTPGSRLSRPDALFHSSHLGSEFRVLVLRLSVPNRVWDFMGSPLLTYLASNISRGGPS